MVDKTYCASSYLMYRAVIDEAKQFAEGLKINRFDTNYERKPVYTSSDLFESLKQDMQKMTSGRKVALALSGGIDSAILAKLMPKLGGCGLHLPVHSSWSGGH